ncbi:MAG: long-chain fatty acid--CoA ligase [Deltaproteobacteria bacterium]|nr:long-chain fatty acid--CoA ligase [Deltaproteobacteria bacterium]
MQDYPLLLSHMVMRAERLFARVPIASRGADGMHRYNYGELVRRVRRLANVLRQLGVQAGDRVGSFAWNTHRHLELYLGVPSYGAVLHTINIRLFAEQIAYIINHAEDAVLFVDDSLLSALEPLADQLGCVRAFVIMGDGALPKSPLHPLLSYEELLRAAPAEFDFPALDENTAAGMCYTSGTTGNPKGVLYSHRALFLQSLLQTMADSFALSERDTLLATVPMFHANAWNLPYSATLVGAAQVYPGAHPQPQDIARLIQEERVTVAAGVPTVWIGVLGVLEQTEHDLSSLRCVPCGGSAVPPSLIEAYDRLGVTITQAWGLTESSPLVTVSRPRQHMLAWPAAQQQAVRAKQGTILPGLEIRAMDDAGRELAWDGKSVGELQLRGPWIISSYYNDPRSEQAFADGWFKTGDVATIDEDGYVQITDRAKDVIKSGGEWISSVDLENALMGHPQVLEAAVIGLPHPQWQERPLACVVPKPGQTINKEALYAHLRDRFAKWWLPEDIVFIETLPKTSVGKFAKRELREQMKDYRWPQAKE